MDAREYWDRKLNQKAPKTVTLYSRAFDGFMAWAGLTSEQFYETHREALKSQDARDSDRAVDLVADYLKSLEDQGLSASTCNLVLKSVASFFAANKLEFKTRGLRRRGIYNGSRRVKKDEILEIYRYCQRDMKLRNRSLVMTAKDSGLGASDLSQLNVEQFLTAREIKSGGDRFRAFKPFKTAKTGGLAHTILGSESVEEIEKYIGDRRSGPLFLDGNGNRMSPAGIIQQFQRLKRAVDGDRGGVSGHSMRKFFVTMMEEGMPENWVKLIVGKRVGPYGQPQDELVDSYVENYDLIRIFGGQDSSTEEVEALQRRIQELEEDKNRGIMGLEPEAQEALIELSNIMRHSEARVKLMNFLNSLGTEESF